MKDNYQIRSVPRMFEQVANQIVDYITSEKLERGTKIPTERNLSELLEVSRSSVREGLRVLELLRFLESKQGEGTFVSEPPPFLIPSVVLKSPMNDHQMKNYFEMAMVCAESILIHASARSLTLPGEWENDQDHAFSWPQFHRLITFLGSNLENSYFVSLWSDIYTLLHDNEFFNHFIMVDMTFLLKAYYQQDEKMIRNIFSKVKESLV